MKLTNICLSSFIALAAIPALADVTYTQATQVTGGMAAKMGSMFGGSKAKEPINTTTIIKGNRMAHASKDHTTVWDLDRETVTSINFKDKSYSVMTFAEMKEMYEKALERMSNSKKPEMEMSMDVKVTETANTRTISGYSAKEVVFTMVIKMADPKSSQSMDTNLENHIWIAKDVPASKELRDFHMRMAKKIGFSPDSMRSSMNAQPGMGKAIAEMAKKAAALEGFHIETVSKVMATGEMAKAMQGMEQARGESGKNASEGAKQGAKDGAERTAENEATSAVGRSLGRFGGIGAGAIGGLARGAKKKPAEEKPKETAKAPAPAAASSEAVLAETLMTTTSITASADASAFDFPSSFKKVASKAENFGQ